MGLEKLYIFLRGLNKKLPRKDKDELSDILSSIDLDYFKIEKKYTSTIELEDTDGEFEGIDVGGGSPETEEEIDLFSEIINILNDSFDGDYSDEDKVRIEKIKEQIQEDETLRTVMEGDNSDSNKRDVFNRTFESLLVGLVGENLNFYNKLSEPKKNRFVKDRLFDVYSKSVTNSPPPPQ